MGLRRIWRLLFMPQRSRPEIEKALNLLERKQESAHNLKDALHRLSERI